jgi:hypothetical protein
MTRSSGASGGNSEVLRLDGRQALHFPQLEDAGAGNLFAESAAGSLATDAWIEAGMTYEFTLRGGLDRSKPLARLLVHGVPESALAEANKPIDDATPRKDGVLLTATPNPVPVGQEPGVTKITWNTGDGSHGRVYVSSVGVYAGCDPIDDEEAKKCVEAVRTHGAEYLLLPSKSFYWLDRYKHFRRHMETCYPVIVRKEDTCIIFDLR